MTRTARFRYLADPLFLLGCGLYLLNRLVLKETVGGTFLVSYFNDLLLVACAVPVLLGIYRWMGLRGDDGWPRAREIFPVLVVWSLLFEWVGPQVAAGAVGDWGDVLAYWMGGCAAWGVWRLREHEPQVVREL